MVIVQWCYGVFSHQDEWKCLGAIGWDVMHKAVWSKWRQVWSGDRLVEG